MRRKLTCSAPTRLSGRPLMTAWVKRVITTLKDQSPSSEAISRDLSYPTALSAKFRIYFLASIRSRTTSATCLILLTKSTTYADRPDTLSRSFHGVFRMAARAGSHAVSSSFSSVAMHVDMTLVVDQQRLD